jgi:hypothetical protein
MNKNYFSILTVFTVFLSCFSIGCDRGPQKPKDFPDLFPCKITITQGGSPLEGALVFLSPKSGVSNGWNTEGKTDSKGVADLKTHVDFKGAPAGDYVVRISKTELSPSSVSEIEPKDPVEYDKWDRAKRAEKRTMYNLVKTEFNDAKKTPHFITISKGKNEAAFDVGEPIKDEIK